MIPSSERLDQGLIVSVQAPPGSPMRDPDVIAAMAEASLRCGAVGVRLESPEHIGAVRRRCPDALIIGLWKCTFPDSSVYITPGWREIQAVWSAGADVIAVDATQRHRPDGQQLDVLISRCRSELRAPLMADVDSIANGLKAAELGNAQSLSILSRILLLDSDKFGLQKEQNLGIRLATAGAKQGNLNSYVMLGMGEQMRDNQEQATQYPYCRLYTRLE